MVNILYSVMAAVNAIVMILLNQYINSGDNGNTEEKKRFHYYKMLIWISIGFSVVDALWGFVGAGVLGNARILFYIASMLFHIMASVTPYFWYRYTVIYLTGRTNLVGRIITFVPLFAALAILATNPLTEWVFKIDENMHYTSGSLRIVLFVVQLCYLFLGMIRAVFIMIPEKDSFRKSRTNTAIISLIISMAFGIFQLWFPDAPYYTIGYMLAMIVMFTGNVTIERERILKDKTQYYKNESKEVYNALEALASNYVSIHLFDLKKDTVDMVHSNDIIESFSKQKNTAAEKIANVMNGVSEESCVDKIVEFVNLSTLNERMKGKNSISMEFRGKNIGYCESTFIEAEKDKDGNVTKVIHAVQDINEKKIREMEYEMAIKAALENENSIYFELLSMQSTGLLATEMNSRIVVMNDMIFDIYKEIAPSKKKPSTFEELMDVVNLEDKEAVYARIEKVKKEGGNYKFEFNIDYSDNKKLYFVSDSKRIKSKTGKMYLITTFTDISQNKQMENKLLVLSETDALTQISNRGSGEARISSFLEENIKGLFCILDVNKFKKINDTYGHQTGDKALVGIAECLRSSFRENDVIMRLGGDEFAIFADGVCDEKSANMVINRFYDSVAKIEIPEMKGKKITISLGAVFSGDDEYVTFDSLFKKADKAMYECKTNKLNTYVLFKEEG